jgi:carbamate kinase
MAKIVVALGGNALSKDGKATAADQLAVANETALELVKLITAGHTLAIVHGNGPQIGNIILHEEAINTKKTPTMPVDVAGAMSQGQIGYWLQNALRNQLEQLKIKKPIASIVTQVLVSKDDPAFKNPSKPIGPFYTEEEAKKLAKTRGIAVKEDAGRGWRKVVPSPMPLSIIESDLIKIAIGNGAVIVAGGGGGIPVCYDQHGRLTGLEAVIDKDFAAEKLAETIDADILLILTAVDNVKVNYKQPDEKTLTEITVDDAFKLIAQGQFAAGSMLPKVEAGVSFVSGANKRVCIITSPEKASKAIDGKAGTRIVAN